jgi:hypothetical protein
MIWKIAKLKSQERKESMRIITHRGEFKFKVERINENYLQLDLAW